MGLNIERIRYPNSIHLKYSIIEEWQIVLIECIVSWKRTQIYVHIKKGQRRRRGRISKNDNRNWKIEETTRIIELFDSERWWKSELSLSELG